MKVQVRKCRFTGKIFEEKDLKKYALHLKKLRIEMKEKREEDRVKKDWIKWLKAERKRIKTIDEIVPWFLANQKRIMYAANAMGHRFSSDKFYPETDSFTKMVLGVRYNPLASNSHRCPDNGITNWCGKNPNPSDPTSYKGWTGNIAGTLTRAKKNNYSYPYGEALKIVGLKTGSGGGGNENWNYGVTIFLDDWPGLKHEIDLTEQELVVKKLKGIA